MLPEQIFYWLIDQGITEEVINGNHLGWDDDHLVIPIYSPSGKFIFNKYRRDPFSARIIPKYKYDPGATAQLFHADRLHEADTVFITEGEKDAMRLESEGLLAVSTTGGAGTWKPEWNTLLQGKDLYLCYDNDDPGIRGAVKMLTYLPAKMIIIPRSNGVKDICDFFQHKSRQDFEALITNSRAYPELSEIIPDITVAKNVRDTIKLFNESLDALREQERDDINNDRQTFHYEPLRAAFQEVVDRMERLRKPIKKDLAEDNIVQAKKYPIEKLYGGKLKRQGHILVGKCPFHDDGTPSFTVYTKNNRWWCYGCLCGGDAIDYMIKKDNLSFNEAVKKLL